MTTADTYRLPGKLLWQVLAVAGAALCVAGILQDPERGWANLLLASYYALGLGLGGMVMLALFYVTGARWSSPLRRVPEAMTTLLLLAALPLLLVVFAHPSLYPWSNPNSQGSQDLSPFQRVWLNWPFFLVRSVLYLALWITLALAIVRNSRRQDQSGAMSFTVKNVRLSALSLVVFAVTCWLAGTDWIMSLEPKWSSTIFGVYQFAGIFLSSLAAVSIVAIGLYWQGPLRRVLTRDRLHDLGTLLFGFSSFWMYIWFSQYLLIWYVNNPEETTYFTTRQRGDWQPLLLLNLVLNWGIPFAVLLFRSAKEKPWVLFLVAGVVLVGRWLDLYLMILPPVVPVAATPGVWEVGPMLMALASGTLAVGWALGRAAVIPIHDPSPGEGASNLPRTANASTAV
jgi:hypothetical protein